MKKEKENLWQKIKWKLYLKELLFKLKLSDYKNSWKKFKHCRKGYHHFKTDYISLSSYKKKRERTIRTDFHECIICGLLIFATGKDKRNWLLIKKHEKGIDKKMVEQMLKGMKRSK